MAAGKRRLISLQCVIFSILTLIVIHSSGGASVFVNARVLKVIIPPTKNFSVPKILGGSLCQIILMGDNLKEGLWVTLTKEPEAKGKYCNSKYMVTPPLNTYTLNSENTSNSVHFFLSPSINKNLSNLTNVWICLSENNYSRLSESSNNYLNPVWVHQGEASKILIQSSDDRPSNMKVASGANSLPLEANDYKIWEQPLSMKHRLPRSVEPRPDPASRDNERGTKEVAIDSPSYHETLPHHQQSVSGVSKVYRSSSFESAVSERARGETSSQVVVSNPGFRTSGTSGQTQSVAPNGVGDPLSSTRSTNPLDSDLAPLFSEDDGNSTSWLILSSSEEPAFSMARVMDTGVPRSRGTRNIEDQKGSASENTLFSSSPLDDVLTPDSAVRSQVRVTGLRVESHSKGIDYDEGTVLLLADTEAEIRLFGVGLTKSVAIQFTAHNNSFGGRCDSSTSDVFQLETAHGYWALLKVHLPIMATSQRFWFLCVREGPANPAVHQGSPEWLTISTYSALLPIGLQVIVLIVLLMLSGLFSGLNLGLMALDKTELKIVMNTGTPKERKYARSIEPVRRHGNFLLCTLLLGNVLVNSTLTILLDTLSSGLIAVIGSTTGIVIFGEIVPQAICSRHGLAVGARTAWLVRIFMVLTGVVSWPISKLLDLLLGEEIGNTYDRERLKELIKVTQDRNDLRLEEQNIICGALELSRKTVAEVMTKLEDVFMLTIDRSLDFNTINEIMEKGYSRIPIYDGERTNIMSVLMIKDLAFIDPDDNTPLRTLTQYYQNVCNFVFEDTKLDVIFKEFKEGNKGHMAFVQRVNSEGDCDPFYEVIGLVTLEDVIEELIQAEIVDETDVFTDNKSKRRRKHIRRDFREFSQQNQSNTKKVQVSPQLQVAAFQYLRTSVEPFKEGNLSEAILKRMLNQDIMHIIKNDPSHSHNQSQNLIFVQGKPVDFFVLILEGHVLVTIGKENLTFESGPFTYFGLMALSMSAIGESPSPSTHLSRNSIVGSVQSLDSNKFCFTPDYSVKASTEVTFLKVKRAHYVAARRAYLMEQSHKDPLAEETFEREMEKMLRDESLTSPVWESENDKEPTAKDALLNGGTIRSKHSDQAEMTIVADDRRLSFRDALIPLNPSNHIGNPDSDHGIDRLSESSEDTSSHSEPRKSNKNSPV